MAQQEGREAGRGVWGTRPVFVCSTFADMQAERDHLRNVVFPELAERLAQYRQHLEPIDLRWGVETVAAGDEEAKELLVLTVCLDEIERSRPFFLGLLGDRYGSVPPEERMHAAAQEAHYEEDVRGRSITALEIEFGVLNSPDQRRRCHFYLREPLPYDRMTPDVTAQYSTEHEKKEGAQEAAQRLRDLKARLERELPGRVHRYAAQWDEEQQQVVGLEEWGQQVLEDLWRDIEEESRTLAQRPALTWQEEERWTLEQFVGLQTRHFVGRAGITDDLRRAALAPAGEGTAEGGPQVICVTGEPGSGKSALLAHLYQTLRVEVPQEDSHTGKVPRGLLSRLLRAPSPTTAPLILFHAAGISVRSSSVDAMLARWTEELADFLGVRTPVTEGTTGEELEEAFRSLLGRVCQRGRVVLLVDALNQFEPTPRGRYVTWLPRLLPRNVCVIATAIPDTQSQALLDRPDATELALPPFQRDEAEKLALAICEGYHRKLNPQVLSALMDRTLPDDGSPSWGNPLWLNLAVERLNLLDADDFRRLDTNFQGDADKRLRDLLLDVVAHLPPRRHGHVRMDAGTIGGAARGALGQGLRGFGSPGPRRLARSRPARACSGNAGNRDARGNQGALGGPALRPAAPQLSRPPDPARASAAVGLRPRPDARSCPPPQLGRPGPGS